MPFVLLCRYIRIYLYVCMRICFSMFYVCVSFLYKCNFMLLYVSSCVCMYVCMYYVCMYIGYRNRPVRIISIAFAFPIARIRRCVPPPPYKQIYTVVSIFICELILSVVRSYLSRPYIRLLVVDKESYCIPYPLIAISYTYVCMCMGYVFINFVLIW